MDYAVAVALFEDDVNKAVTRGINNGLSGLEIAAELRRLAASWAEE